MKKLILATLVLILSAGGAFAGVIDFDAQGWFGPSTFGAAGPAQTRQTTVDGVTVTFTGGVILTNTTNMPADQTSVYGTADFGNNLSNPLTVTFSNAITNFFLDVLNGETFSVDYRVADNAGHSSIFSLVPNLQSGAATIGFAAAGTVVTIEAITGLPSWDFFIDNVHFDEPLPPGLGIPEPATFLLLGGGLAGLGIAFRRRSRV